MYTLYMLSCFSGFIMFSKLSSRSVSKDFRSTVFVVETCGHYIIERNVSADMFG